MDRAPGRVILVLAAAAGVWAGWLDLLQPGFREPLLLIAAAGFVAGFARPAGAVPAALLLGAGVPLMHLAHLVLGVPSADDTAFPWTFFALVPALISALAGVGVRQSMLRNFERAS
ncbi:MAG: hypothetical protein KDA22_06770 [Phycisphaerales bacterium]|nr:hypothetical protein [Phycisphaerales bacterium]